MNSWPTATTCSCSLPPFEFRASYARDLAHRHLLRAGEQQQLDVTVQRVLGTAHPGRQPARDCHRGRQATRPADQLRHRRRCQHRVACGRPDTGAHPLGQRDIFRPAGASLTRLSCRNARISVQSRPPLPRAPSPVTDDLKKPAFKSWVFPTSCSRLWPRWAMNPPRPSKARPFPACSRAKTCARTGPDRHRQDRGVSRCRFWLRIDVSQNTPQALVMVPTRELAIQVAEAFQKYAVTHAGLPCAADLRRPELYAAVEGAEARRPGHRGDPGSGHGPYEARHAGPVHLALRGAGRRRRDAADGLRR